MIFLVLVLVVALAGPASAQARAERVTYANAADGTPLAATLHLPGGSGPFPAVVVLSLAGVQELVGGMERRGVAVMVPERRGMGGTPEMILRASFRDMAADVDAALAYLRSRPEVDAETVGMLAQGGEAMPGSMAAVEPAGPAFLVLVSPPGVRGDEGFRLQQRLAADRRGLSAEEVEELDRLVGRLAEIVRGEDEPDARARRIRALLADAPVRPQRSASFPSDVEGQVRFFSSPWWRDFFAFSPEVLLSRVGVPTLVLLGLDDPFVPFERNAPPIRRSLEAAPTDDATVCLVEGRVQHGFPAGALDAVEAWLAARVGPGGVTARPGAPPPAACVEEPAGR